MLGAALGLGGSFPPATGGSQDTSLSLPPCPEAEGSTPCRPAFDPRKSAGVPSRTHPVPVLEEGSSRYVGWSQGLKREEKW